MSELADPKISVIVPIYDTERYIEKCITSILNQTLEDIEIICVDDCSPDDSGKIVEDMAGRDERIRLIRHSRNLGLGGARNTGIQAARADYLASVDSDDYIDPSMLAALWQGTEESRHDVVVCGYEIVDENGSALERRQTRVKTVDPVCSTQNPFTLSNPAFWNKLWRKSLFIDNDIYFPEHIYYQDSATTPRIYKKANSINFIGGVYYKYLKRSTSVTRSTSDKHLIDKFRELDTVKEFFIGEGDYGRHALDFRERVINSFKYHSGNVYQNNARGDVETDRYLRYLLMMREAYLMMDDELRSMSLEEKALALQNVDCALNVSLKRRSEAIAEPVVNRDKSKTFASYSSPRILVLTLYSGEKEFDRSCASLAAQVYQNWEHKILKNLPNADAHHRLYLDIMQSAGDYELFLKLDADMVIANVNILQEITETFQRNSDLDHLVVPCDDFMTGEQIMGVHCFSNRVTWRSNADGLFLDPSPKRPGRRIILELTPQPMFLHSPDPSSLQAFHFGAHRCLKLVQRDRSGATKRSAAIKTQWHVLRSTWERFKKGRDRRHGLALIAADCVITGEIGAGAHSYEDRSLHAAFARAKALSVESIEALLAMNWSDAARQRSYFIRAVDPELQLSAAEVNLLLQRSALGAATGGEAGSAAVPARSFRTVYGAARKRFATKNFPRALNQMQAALALAPKSKLARVGIAEALLGLGKIKESRQAYDDLVQRFPAEAGLVARYNELLTTPGSIEPQSPKALKPKSTPKKPGAGPDRAQRPTGT